MGKRIWKTSSSWTLQQNGSLKPYRDKPAVFWTAPNVFLPLRPTEEETPPGSLWFPLVLDLLGPFTFWQRHFLNTGGPENCQITQGVQWQFKSTWNSFWWNLCENNTPRLWDEKKKLKISALEIQPSGNINLKYQTVVQVKEKHSILEDLVSRQPVVVLWWRYCIFLPVCHSTWATLLWFLILCDTGSITFVYCDLLPLITLLCLE